MEYTILNTFKKLLENNKYHHYRYNITSKKFDYIIYPTFAKISYILGPMSGTFKLVTIEKLFNNYLNPKFDDTIDYINIEKICITLL
jgi:hypothetical protein